MYWYNYLSQHETITEVELKRGLFRLIKASIHMSKTMKDLLVFTRSWWRRFIEFYALWVSRVVFLYFLGWFQCHRRCRTRIHRKSSSNKEAFPRRPRTPGRHAWSKSAHDFNWRLTMFCTITQVHLRPDSQSTNVCLIPQVQRSKLFIPFYTVQIFLTWCITVNYWF